MGWKDWSYARRGGFIGIGIVFLFLIVDNVITKFAEFHLFSILAGFFRYLDI